MNNLLRSTGRKHTAIRYAQAKTTTQSIEYLKYMVYFDEEIRGLFYSIPDIFEVLEESIDFQTEKEYI